MRIRNIRFVVFVAVIVQTVVLQGDDNACSCRQIPRWQHCVCLERWYPCTKRLHDISTQKTTILTRFVRFLAGFISCASMRKVPGQHQLVYLYVIMSNFAVFYYTNNSDGREECTFLRRNFIRYPLKPLFIKVPTSIVTSHALEN